MDCLCFLVDIRFSNLGPHRRSRLQPLLVLVARPCGVEQVGKKLPGEAQSPPPPPPPRFQALFSLRTSTSQALRWQTKGSGSCSASRASWSPQNPAPQAPQTHRAWKKRDSHIPVAQWCPVFLFLGKASQQKVHQPRRMDSDVFLPPRNPLGI